MTSLAILTLSSDVRAIKVGMVAITMVIGVETSHNSMTMTFVRQRISLTTCFSASNLAVEMFAPASSRSNLDALDNRVSQRTWVRSSDSSCRCSCSFLLHSVHQSSPVASSQTGPATVTHSNAPITLINNSSRFASVKFTMSPHQRTAISATMKS